MPWLRIFNWTCRINFLIAVDRQCCMMLIMLVCSWFLFSVWHSQFISLFYDAKKLYSTVDCSLCTFTILIDIFLLLWSTNESIIVLLPKLLLTWTLQKYWIIWPYVLRKKINFATSTTPQRSPLSGKENLLFTNSFIDISYNLLFIVKTIFRHHFNHQLTTIL